MSAPNRRIADTQAKLSRSFWTAKCWMGILDQHTYWVPRGAWRAYCDASLQIHTSQEVVGALPDGTPATVGPIRRTMWVRPTFDVPGVVHVEDMDISWRQNVISFLWRRHSKALCRAMAWRSFMELGAFADAPDDVFDDLISDDLRYDGLAGDDDARYAWFNELPLIAELRNSIVVDRDIARGGPVLLGGGHGAHATEISDLDGLLVTSDHDEVVDNHLIELLRRRALDDMRSRARRS